MAGDPVAVLPVRRDPGADRWGVVGRSRVVGRRRIVGRRRCHHDRRGIDAIAIVAVPPGVRRLGRGGNADGGEAKDGAGGGDLADALRRSFLSPPDGLFDAPTLGASNWTSIQETRFVGFVRNCANFAESAAQAKSGKMAEVFPRCAPCRRPCQETASVPKLAFVRRSCDPARQPIQAYKFTSRGATNIQLVVFHGLADLAHGIRDHPRTEPCQGRRDRLISLDHRFAESRATGGWMITPPDDMTADPHVVIATASAARRGAGP